MLALRLICVVLLSSQVLAQEIWDNFQTRWDRSRLFTYENVNPPIRFGSGSGSSDASITVDDGSTYQSVWGMGGSMTDSSAKMLNNLKNANSNNYWNLLRYLFDPTDGNNAAGLNYIRVNLGASDFADSRYTFVGGDIDIDLSSFNIDKAPWYLFSVLSDVKSVNSLIKIHIVPWSPPGWMKDSGSMAGGSFLSAYTSVYARYLLECVQGFTSKGLRPYAITIQNEPEYSDGSYPTCRMTYTQEGEIAKVLRPLLDNNGFSSVRLIGYDHNWNDAGGYPVYLMRDYGQFYDGVAFHCYAGSVENQGIFHRAYPQKEIYFTECTGVPGTDWWSDIKSQTASLYIGAINQHAHTVLMWNIALDPNGEPRLPGTNSCGIGCRPIVTVNGGSWSVNQEFYGLAHVSKAILPKDAGGPWGKRMGISIGGSYSWALRVAGFVTGRVSSSDWNRYSLVVMNWRDSEGGWNPQPVYTSIVFRGNRAWYNFPVGLTTLWWYAPANAVVGGNDEEWDGVLHLYSQGQNSTVRLFEKDDSGF